VKDGLIGAGVSGMSVEEVRINAWGKEWYRGALYDILMLPKEKLILLIARDQLEDVIRIIRDVPPIMEDFHEAIAITPLKQVIRIRTGETGPEAL